MRQLILFFSLAFFFISCDDDHSFKNADADYLPMEVGNYWVYQHYEIDENGIASQINRRDSLYVSHDTIIGDQTFYILREKRTYISGSSTHLTDKVYRYSDGYLKNSEGSILFSEKNFTDTLYTRAQIINENDTLFILSCKMVNNSDLIETPAGIFETLNYKGTIDLKIETYTDVEFPRYINNYYSRGVGKVLDSYFYMSSPINYERRLIDYYLQ